MSMYFGTAAIVAGAQQRLRHRNPNLLKTACRSMEDIYLSLSVFKQQIQTLARKFTKWQGWHEFILRFCWTKG